MSRSYDVIVAGLGAMGSATAYQLARRGARVLGLDRFRPPHAHGSSHGESRIIREAYFEDPAYVPLVQRAYELWHALEDEAGETLLRTSGVLTVGTLESEAVEGAIRSAELHGLAYHRLNAQAVRQRYPAFRPDDAMVGVFEPRAGVLDPERCVGAQLRLAAARGAELRTGEPMLRWRQSGDAVVVETRDARYSAGALVLALGPWLPETVPALPLRVERQVVFWFRPRTPAEFAPERCPAFLFSPPGGRLFYGVPDLGTGVKAAIHHGGETGPLHQLSPEVRPDDVRPVRELLARYLPDLEGEPLRGVVCRYTNTPSHRFLLDRHPEQQRVWLVSPCSGHGFKFASVVGEIAADLATGQPPRFDLSAFCLAAV